MAEVTIDRKPITDAFAPGYLPHALAARILAIPNVLLAFAGICILGALLLRWAIHQIV